MRARARDATVGSRSRYATPILGLLALRCMGRYFPGPIDGSLFSTDGTGVHPEGRDPSTITNFAGVVGQVDAVFSGTGMDTTSGAQASYSFHTDTRFIQGQFIGSDEQIHRGTFAFI